MSGRLAAGAIAVPMVLVAGLVWIANKPKIDTDPLEHAVQLDLVQNTDRPFLAIWRVPSGMFGGSFLRIVIWDRAASRWPVATTGQRNDCMPG